MLQVGNLSLLVVVAAIIVSYWFWLNAKPALSMANTGLLLVSSVTKVHTFLTKASQYVKKVLYVNVDNNNSSSLSQQIVKIYSKATSQCNNLDVRLILKPGESCKEIRTNYPIDIVLCDHSLSQDVTQLKLSVKNLSSGYNIQCIDIQDTSAQEISPTPIQTYDYVVLGGTFDRLHNGHKILLSQAVLRTTKLLTVGVTDVSMIQTKKLFELIEPVEQRIKSVLDFLTDINPSIDYDVLPIQDMYGPTKEDPRFQLIILSEETERGGDKVNEKRKENGLSILDKFIVELAEDVSPQHSHEEEHKVSSSNQRMRLLGTQLKPSVPNPNIPDWPYVIGLAGGIASGKSNIAEYLKIKGAAIVNCDIIAHELYKPGLPLNGTIAETFGRDVIMENGEVDRRKLGQMVFSDKNQLERLNQLVWPAVIEEAQRRIRALGDEGHKIVVMEAAVMIRAKWYMYCHQLWTVIIPPAEAVKRMQKRNGLSEEEAKQRIDAQPSNLEQVEPANVVFSPYWSYRYTQSQVDRAWNELQQYLKNRQ